MGANQFKYTITMTQNTSPSLWNIAAMTKNLVDVRNRAYETEAALIEKELDKRGLVDAQQVIQSIMSKK